MICETFMTMPKNNDSEPIEDEDSECNSELLIKKITTAKKTDTEEQIPDPATNEFQVGKLSQNLNRTTITCMLPVGERERTVINQNNHYYATTASDAQSITEENIFKQQSNNITNQGMALSSTWMNKEHKTAANQAQKNYFEIKKKNMEEEERNSSHSSNNKSSSTESSQKIKVVAKSEVRELQDDEEEKELHSRPQIMKQEARDSNTGGTEPNFRGNINLARDDYGKLKPSNTYKPEGIASLNSKDDTITSSATHAIPKTIATDILSESSELSDFKRKPLAEVLLWSGERQKLEQPNQPTFGYSNLKWEEPQRLPRRPLEDVFLYDYDNQQQWHDQVPSVIGENRTYTIQDPQHNVYHQSYGTTPQTIQEYQPYQHYIVTSGEPSIQQHYLQSTTSTPIKALSTSSPVKGQRSTISQSPHSWSRVAAPASPSSTSSPHGLYSTQSYASASGSGSGSQQQRGTGASSPRFLHSQQHSTGGGSRSSTPHRQYGQGRPATPPASTIREGSNPSTPTSTTIPTTSSNRSGPDILKTLLRKKACLYEPETSQAIALITWLVGRHLALSHGYFSRQQLQAGVHHVVQNNITSGVITRTKVNRCMQIILNCCFHYIIPRPDGIEDSGEVFCKKFESYAVDDSYKILNLPYPWNDIDVNALLQSWDSDVTTKDDTEEPVKRTVLLCFNENVKSSDDVFQCHKDFIRDAANSANLHLTSNDWKHFFLGESSGTLTSNAGPAAQQDTASCASSSTNTTTTAPYSPSASIVTTSPLHTGSCAQSSTSSPLSLPVSSWHHPLYQQSLPPSPIPTESSTSISSSDYFGRMTYKELSDFRTSWCAKRYDHDASLCGFAHTEINRGWLRRSPASFTYVDKFCDNIIPLNLSNTTSATTVPTNKEKYYFNACPFGKLCSFAHSQEEIDYHPNQYKTNICSSSTHATARPAWKSSSSSTKSIMKSCPLRDICPNYHPYRYSQQQHHHHYQEGRQHQQSHSRFVHHSYHHYHQQHHHHFGDYHSTSSPQQRQHQTISKSLPIAPMMYILPSPISDFEQSLTLPGLRTLFRQRSSTIYSSVTRSNRNEQQQQVDNIIPYTLFGDVTGTRIFSNT